MAFENLKIRAMDGSALVEGCLSLSSKGSLAAALPSAGSNDIIGIQLTHNKLHRCAVNLYRKSYRAADGLYAVAAPIITFEFSNALLNMHRLMGSMFRETARKVILRGEDVYPLVLRFTPEGRENAPTVYAALEEVAIEVRRRENGMEIQIEGISLPFSLEKDGPLLDDVRLHCEILLPPAYCALSLIGNYSGGMESHTEWRGGLSGLDEVPMSYAALGMGLVDWQQDSASRRCKGPFVQAYLHEHEMTFRPARRIWKKADGMARADLDTDGPEVRLGLGRALIANLLADDEHAHVSFRTGIGHVDGQTGRSVGESGGPLRQNLRWLDLKLNRYPHELRIEGEGELEPLKALSGPSSRSLGPRLQFNFALQRTWLLARGIELPRFWDDWKKELDVTGVW